MDLLKKIVNKIIRLFITNSIENSQSIVYLTFDDGPESGICEFVLNELKKYNFKATFFCRGDNAEQNHLLLDRIISEGHAVGNHTYSHLHSYNCTSREYYNDVEKADRVLNTFLFRPPHGSLTLVSYLKLRKKYKSYFWSLNSGDSDMEHYDFNRSICRLKSNTKPGDIVLFHFCKRHEKETRELLPVYLAWLNDNGYSSKAITI